MNKKILELILISMATESIALAGLIILIVIGIKDYLLYRIFLLMILVSFIVQWIGIYLMSIGEK